MIIQIIPIYINKINIQIHIKIHIKTIHIFLNKINNLKLLIFINTLKIINEINNKNILIVEIKCLYILLI